MAKIIRVDLSQKAIYSESVPVRYFMLGGRGLTSQIIFDEVNPNCDPLGKNSELPPSKLGGFFSRTSSADRLLYDLAAL